MKQIKHPLLGTLSLLLIFGSTNLMASANAIVDKNSAKTVIIEKLIRQHIALGRLKNTFHHPIIANRVSRAIRNPFLDAPKSLSATLAKKGVNLSALARYKAIYFNQELLGSNARRVINIAPDTVLVIGKSTKLHKKIYSRGPVVVAADPNNLAGIYGNNIVWFNQQTKHKVKSYETYLAMPFVNGRENPDIVTAPQVKLNYIKVERKKQCQSYANEAVQKYNENRQLSCGFSGIRWSNDWKSQYNWCMTMLAPATWSEIDFRKDSIASCKKKVVSVNNPKNRPAIPEACNDPSKQYGAVKRIDHSFRYDKTFKSPVNNGMIRYDYNRDQRHDYVFLEINEDKARVAICMSNGNAYQRHVTDVTFSAAGDGTGGYEHIISQQGDLLHVDIAYFEHNGGSSGRNVSYRYQTNTKNFKIISDKSDAYGIEQDGYTYPIQSPQTPYLY